MPDTQTYHADVVASPLVKILPFPYWGRKIRNLRTMYFAPQAAGWELIKDVESADHLLVNIQALSAGDVVHINGLRPLGTALAAEPEFAQTMIETFTRAQQSGVKVIWTLHHVLTPDSLTPEADLEVHKILADIADVIVIPHANTVTAIGGLYQLDPAKIRIIPNASYLGVFADDESDAVARERLGLPTIESDDVANKTVGYIDNFASFEQLSLFVQAMKLVQEEHPGTHAIICCRLAEGEGDEESDNEVELEEETTTGNNPAQELVSQLEPVTAKLGYLPRNRRTTWYRACDVVVFPDYRDIDPDPLLAAATFGRRVIIPNDSILALELANESWVYAYAAGEPGQDDSRGLADSIVAALADAASADSSAGADHSGSSDNKAISYARKQTPFSFSRAYLRLFESQ